VLATTSGTEWETPLVALGYPVIPAPSSDPLHYIFAKRLSTALVMVQATIDPEFTSMNVIKATTYHFQVENKDKPQILSDLALFDIMDNGADDTAEMYKPGLFNQLTDFVNKYHFFDTTKHPKLANLLTYRESTLPSDVEDASKVIKLTQYSVRHNENDMWSNCGVGVMNRTRTVVERAKNGGSCLPLLEEINCKLDSQKSNPMCNPESGGGGVTVAPDAAAADDAAASSAVTIILGVAGGVVVIAGGTVASGAFGTGTAAAAGAIGSASAKQFERMQPNIMNKPASLDTDKLLLRI
tara:strand:- start:1187 stop:2077 length:891 start_codon:yes stop_codon:yes gene_type:complete